MTKLYAYTMTHDNGFAPHVDREGQFLTLATCKPAIRRKGGKGDWILGIAGKKRLGGPETGRVVYLAEVTRAPISFDEYFRDPSFKGRPDNIYEGQNGSYKQVPNPFHPPDEKGRDTSVDAVLVSENFVYFGAQGPELGGEGFGELVLFRRGHAPWPIERGSVAERLILHARETWKPWGRWHSPNEDGPSPCDDGCGAGEEASGPAIPREGDGHGN